VQVCEGARRRQGRVRPSEQQECVWNPPPSLQAANGRYRRRRWCGRPVYVRHHQGRRVAVGRLGRVHVYVTSCGCVKFHMRPWRRGHLAASLWFSSNRGPHCHAATNLSIRISVARTPCHCQPKHKQNARLTRHPCYTTHNRTFGAKVRLG
jgi:hypothetical protein